MFVQPKLPVFLLSSFAVGAFAAFASAAALDYVHFQRAVEASEHAIRRQYREVLAQQHEHLNETLFDETRRARQRATDEAHAEVSAISSQLKAVAEVAEVRRKLLETRASELRTANAENQQLKSQIAASGPSADPIRKSGIASGARAISSTSPSTMQSAEDLAAMRAGFRRRLEAEIEARKKPKGPVYLNTPQGRVILIENG